jgi:RES domain
MDSLAVLVAACPRADVGGTWQRHVAARYGVQALDGRRGTGRWSTKDGFPVLYLGRPTNSVIVEAYRRLVDPVEDERMLAHLEPRALVTCTVAVTDLLDLREATSRMQLDLPFDILHSPTSDRDAYARCQAVAQVAHQIGLNGIVTPAATGLGYTLALFTDILPAEQRPTRCAPDIAWDRLPADPRHIPPRHLRSVETGS